MKYIFVIIAIACLQQGFAQTTNVCPEVGQPCPDFYFKDVRFYSQKHVSLADFKGRWLVLDFWNRYCHTCMDKMPSTDSLQKTFRGQVQFLLVGYTGSHYTHHADDKAIHHLYPKLRKRLNIDLPVAYDSLLFHRFDIGACPYIVVIDPAGIVRAVTIGLNKQNMKNLMSGKPVTLEKATNRKGL
jgi:thiol-disulfide isomerase/thioredoxin